MDIIKFDKNKKDYIYFFASVAGVLSFVENFLPRVFVFFKIGIGNIPILLIFESINSVDLFLIVIFKSFITLFFSGLLFSPTALMSLSGNIGAFLIMIVLKNIKKISLITKSIVIAYFSNLFQLVIYSFFIIQDFSAVSLIYIVFFLSLITGFITGFIAFSIRKKYLKIVFE